MPQCASNMWFIHPASKQCLCFLLLNCCETMPSFLLLSNCIAMSSFSVSTTVKQGHISYFYPLLKLCQFLSFKCFKVLSMLLTLKKLNQISICSLHFHAVFKWCPLFLLLSVTVMVTLNFIFSDFLVIFYYLFYH